MHNNEAKVLPAALNDTIKLATKNVQLVLQYCYKTS